MISAADRAAAIRRAFWLASLRLGRISERRAQTNGPVSDAPLNVA